jgi:required for meiotic nuclear division protein 1
LSAPAPHHTFHAVAFVENLPLKDLAGVFENARRTPHELRYALPDGRGRVFIYPFGAMVFHDVTHSDRESELTRLRRARPSLTMTPGGAEEFFVREDPGKIPDVHDGVLTLDQLTPERASVVALTIAQSAAMEYYEGAVEQMFEQTGRRVERLEDRGTVSLRTKPLHRFIGAAVSTRSEVLSVLHLFDKPDEAWDDAGMDRIYDELRAEFDLVDRYQAMETKLRTMQESLELILDVARDRRLVSLEVTIVILIGLEIVLEFLRR